MRIAVLFYLLLASAILRAQESPAPSASPPRNVPLRFVPPPLEGTISLGIYDRSGKLVRVLHREDTIADFTAGHDALETTWDGKDDAGNSLPTGRYSARGYLVANLKIEGIDYFFNDWVTDESSDIAHLAHISQIEVRDNLLQLNATTADGNQGLFDFVPATGKLTGAIAPSHPAASPNDAGLLIDPVASATGKDGSVWAISHLSRDSAQVEIVQLSAAPATVLRKLSIEPGAPAPIGIAASTTEDKIFLLEESPALERVRSLTLQSTTTAVDEKQTVSDWKVDFEKKIVAHKNFSIADGKPVATPPNESLAPPKIAQKLRPNPLKRDQPGQVDLAAGVDAAGSYLKTADGLPLRTISDTPNLSRAVLAAHDDKAVDVFQDDGAVVEQFRLSGLDQMMAFDCGDFELK